MTDQPQSTKYIWTSESKTIAKKANKLQNKRKIEKCIFLFWSEVRRAWGELSSDYWTQSPKTLNSGEQPTLRSTIDNKWICLEIVPSDRARQPGRRVPMASVHARNTIQDPLSIWHCQYQVFTGSGKAATINCRRSLSLKSLPAPSYWRLQQQPHQHVPIQDVHRQLIDLLIDLFT